MNKVPVSVAFLGSAMIYVDDPENEIEIETELLAQLANTEIFVNEITWSDRLVAVEELMLD